MTLEGLPDELKKRFLGGDQNNFKKNPSLGQIKQFISNVRHRTDSRKLFP